MVKAPDKPKCSCGKRPFFPAKVRAKVGDFERVITFMPGFRCELTGPRSHGRHGMDMLWLLIGEKGTVQFKLFTGWEPNWVSHAKCDFGPMPADLGYHSKTPRYEGQSLMDGECPWTGGPCYYDGSGLCADDAFKVFVSEGEDALWALMEETYQQTFEDS